MGGDQLHPSAGDQQQDRTGAHVGEGAPGCTCTWASAAGEMPHSQDTLPGNRVKSWIEDAGSSMQLLPLCSTWSVRYGDVVVVPAGIKC